MIARKSFPSFVPLLAILFAAIAAPGASAVPTGTVAGTCEAGGSENYTDQHCDTTSGGLGSGSYGIELIKESPTSGVKGTNAETKGSTKESTQVVLEATVGGIATKLEATTVSAEGTLENKLEGEVHKILGSGIAITYTSVKVVSPANCTVHSTSQATGTVVTNTLKSESVEGTPMTEKFSPKAGTEIAKLEFGGGSCALNGVTPTVTGTVSAEPSGQMTAEEVKTTGATLVINVTKASAQLKVGGQNASLTSTVTAKSSSGAAIATTIPAPQFEALLPAGETAKLASKELEENPVPASFELASNSITCKNSTFKADYMTASSTLFLTPEYPEAECEGFGFTSGKIEPGSCVLKLDAPVRADPALGLGKGVIFKVKGGFTSCGAGAKILLKAPKVNPVCEVEITPKDGITSSPRVENTNTRETVRVDATMFDFSYTVKKSVGTCPLTAGSTGNNAHYRSGFELEATKTVGGAHALFRVNG